MRYTPEKITDVGPDEIVVAATGSPAEEGIYGRSYLIPVADATRDAEQLRPAVARFLDLAEEWDQNTFLVTDLANVADVGLSSPLPAEKIAPLFDRALDMYNVVLPKNYSDILLDRRRRLGIPLPEGI